MPEEAKQEVKNGGEGSEDVLKALRTAAKGLLFPSESDKPIKAFLWKSDGDSAKSIDEATVRAAIQAPADAEITTQSVEKFFEPVVAEEDWHGPDEKAVMQRFRALVEALQKHLTGLTVFRVAGSGGDTSAIDAYVVGRTASGEWAGVSTQLIET